MNRKTRFATLAMAAISAVVLAGGNAAFAADEKPAAQKAEASAPNTLSAQEKSEGWKLLFDGKSIEHFRNYNKPDAPVNDKWVVKDGAMALTGKDGGDIITKEQYENYDLVLEYKISPGGNSGLMFGVIEQPGKPPYDSGPEVQIQDNAEGKDPQKAGWLYQLYQPPIDPKTGKPIDATKPAGEWNQLRLKMDNGRGEIFMNGVKYAEFEVGSDEWKARLAKSKFVKWEAFGKSKKGHIALQDHGNEVAFRNVKIKTLDGK